MNTVRGLLVDLDGTLVDTREANFAAYREVLADHEVNLQRNWWDEQGFGRNWRQFLPELLPDRSVAELQTIAQAKQRVYPEFLGLSRVNAPLTAFIAAQRSTTRTALVTTASRASADAVLDFHDLESLFDIKVTGEHVAAHKPAPDAFVEAAQRLSLRADECLVFEDSDIGVAAAHAFGAPCLRITEFASA